MEFFHPLDVGRFLHAAGKGGLELLRNVLRQTLWTGDTVHDGARYIISQILCYRNVGVIFLTFFAQEEKHTRLTVLNKGNIELPCGEEDVASKERRLIFRASLEGDVRY